MSDPAPSNVFNQLSSLMGKTVAPATAAKGGKSKKGSKKCKKGGKSKKGSRKSSRKGTRNKR